MIVIKIKPEYKNMVVGFNNSGVPLGYRNDLLEFALLARSSNDTYLLGMIDGEVPSLEDLKTEKAKQLQLPAVKVEAVVPKTEETSTPKVEEKK